MVVRSELKGYFRPNLKQNRQLFCKILFVDLCQTLWYLYINIFYSWYFFFYLSGQPLMKTYQSTYWSEYRLNFLFNILKNFYGLRLTDSEVIYVFLSKNAEGQFLKVCIFRKPFMKQKQNENSESFVPRYLHNCLLLMLHRRTACNQLTSGNKKQLKNSGFI